MNCIKQSNCWLQRSLNC